MTKDTCHSFDTCPLRSSSLLIVHHERQVIITASEEVLGYTADQLINQPLSLLSLPTTRHGHPTHYQARQMAKTRHAITKQWIHLEVCVHHDPFSKASGLDYCLLREVATDSQQKQQQEQRQQQHPTSTVTLLGLNAYGSIVHAYLAPDSPFPQLSSCAMVGRPIMSFIHTDDVRPLCRLLRKSTTRPLLPSATKDDYTMDVRWLKSTTRKPTPEMSPEFEWMQITIVNPTHIPALNGRPICLLQPLNRASSTTSSALFYGTLTSLMASLENGQTYCMEFLDHLLACFIQLVHDLITISQQSLSSTQQLSPLSSFSPQHIRVMDGTSIRFIPLSSSPSSFLSNNNDNLFYLFSSTFLSYAMPTSFLPNRSLLDLLKPILPQTKSPSFSL